MTLILPQCTCLNFFQNSAKRSNWRRIHSNLWLTLARKAYSLQFTGKKKESTLFQAPPPLVHPSAVTKIKPLCSNFNFRSTLARSSLTGNHSPSDLTHSSIGRSVFNLWPFHHPLPPPKRHINFFFLSWYGRVL